MAKYSKTAQDKVERSMHEMKKGKLRSGSGQKVTNPKQAIAIGLSEARENGAGVPKKSAAKRSPAGSTRNTGKPGSKKEVARKSGTKKSGVKKSTPRKSRR
jgi:Family of unknown function (DUF6496)